MMLKTRINCALIVLLPVLICAQQPNGNDTNFSFSSFSQNNSRQLIYMGNASFSPARGYIDLTPDPNATTSSNQTAPNLALQNCIGRVLYGTQLTVWPASFTTTFTILVKNITTNATGGQKNFNGDGMAFIIVPDNKSFLPDSYGAFLGLFDSATDGNTTGQLAIEFDTYKNEFDPDNNHVGIDIQSIKSNVTANMGEQGMDIKAGRPITVRVDYDGWTKSLQIYAGYADNASGGSGFGSLVNRTVELEKTVPKFAFVGFSASTGNSYEVHRILDWNFSSVMLPESSLNLSPVGTSGGSGGRVNVVVVVVSVSVTAALAGLAALLAYNTIKRRKQAAVSLRHGSFSGELAMIGNAPHRFPYRELAAATNNFSEAELLGRGGFGSVYRGNLNTGGDEGGPWVAVKRISAGSRQGAREFISEIATIGRLRHRNLVQLQGWCHERDELLLVYDYMPNGSLDKILFDRTGEPPLNWQRRQRILCGLASALHYLHEEWEQRVVHRDIKPSNVMLDGEFNPRLGDFGLARLIEHDDNSPAVTTRLAGTPGYVAPECSYTGKATAESDVFSFGIVLLEVATGRRVVERKAPLAEGNLVDWVWGMHSEGRVLECADPKLEGFDYDLEEMRRVLILGLACSHPDPHLRPSIRQALQVLINPNEELPPLPLTRPLAIYVVLPPVGAVYSQSSISFAPQPRGSINSSSGSPVPMSSAPRFNMDNTWSQQSDFQQPNSQPPPSSQSGTQHRQFYNSTNESPVPQTPVRRFSQIPSKDNFWSQQSYSQQQHQQTQIESQPMHYSNSSNESPGPLTPVPRINPVPNKDSFRLPPPHSQPSPPLKQQQQQQQHQSGSQPRQYNGPPGQGSSWLDPRQSPVGRGSAWSGTQGSCSPSSGSSGRGVSWSEPQGSSGGRGTPWMNSRDRGGRAVGGTPSPNQIRGRMQGRGSHVHVSARERPDLFVKKSMVEDPWKNLVPVLMNNLVATGVGNTGMCRSKGSCFDVNNPRSFQPGSISLKKPKVSQIKDNFQSGPSLAESLALSFSEAIGEEACS